MSGGLRVVLVSALLICLTAWGTGRSAQARGLRQAAVALSRNATARWSDNRFAAAVAANRVVIFVGLAALAALVLVLWTNPGQITVLVIVVITGILVLLVNSFKPPRTMPA